MRILFVTDAWPPQRNGVCRTLTEVTRQLKELGHEVGVVEPGTFRTVPAPSYPEIRLAIWPWQGVARQIDAFRPDAIHIMTEGPIGWAGRRHCVRNNLPFTTSFTTRFPEYIQARWGIPPGWGYALLRHYHGAAERLLVTTASLREFLAGHGFTNMAPWGRGVDTQLFRPRDKGHLDLPRPIFLYAGRVSVEKSLADFLSLDLPGSKAILGSGPQEVELRRRFPDAHFLGYHTGEALGAAMAAADVFVFPSRTDTFGLVLLEALACGLPVAAYPVTGPRDVLGGTDVAVLDEDLGKAARAALEIPPERCRDFALRFSWRNCALEFLSLVAPIHGKRPAAVVDQAS